MICWGVYMGELIRSVKRNFWNVFNEGELRGIEFCNKEKIYIVLGVKKRELNRKNDGQNIISVYFKKVAGGFGRVYNKGNIRSKYKEKTPL